MTTAVQNRPTPTVAGIRWHRPLLVLAAAMGVLVVVCLVGLVVDPRESLGVNVWEKPLKFAISTAVYAVTWSWLIGQLQRFQRVAWWAGTISAILLLIELVIITGAAAAGITSHFNVSTPVSTALWSIMAASIGTLWVATFVVSIILFRNSLGDRARTLAIRAGALIALAGMDVGTSFGSLGSRREMLIGFLAEPALLMVIFTASLISQSTSLATIVKTLASKELVIYPSLAFAGVAFSMVSLAENARVPIDNPTTHLELTMVHEAMILEYSGRHLALIEWAASLKLFAYSCLGIALFFPFGIPASATPPALALAAIILFVKLAIGGFLLALIETLSAKMRVFRAPEFLGTAFLLAVLAMMVHVLLETGA